MLTQDIWSFIKQQKERLIILAALISFGAGVVNSLLDKANPPVISLSLFSLIVLAALLWMTFVQSPVTSNLITKGKGAQKTKHKFSIVQILIAWLVGILVVTSSWSFIYRERILYSKLADRFLNTQRIIVSEDVAWHILEFSTPGTQNEKKSNTVAGELSSLLTDLPYHIVIFTKDDLENYASGERDGIIVEGVTEELGSVLKTQMVITKHRIKKLLKQLPENINVFPENSNKKSITTSLPAKLYLRNQFLHTGFKLETPLPPDTSTKYRTTVARVMLRHALATLLFYDEDPAAAELFRENVTIGKILTGKKNRSLSVIYKTIGYYLAVYDKRPELALEALDIAYALAPDDTEINVMLIYLYLALDEMNRAKLLVKQIEAASNEIATAAEISSEYYMAVGDHKSAMKYYKRALRLDKEAGIKAYLNFSIALTYGMMSNISKQERSTQMIRYLEDAIQLNKDVEKGILHPRTAVLYILRAYAWALQGNSKLVRHDFSTASKLIETDNEESLFNYWLGKSMFELRQYDEGIKGLEDLVGDPEKSNDAGLLLILAQNLMNVPNRSADAEKYLDRALQLDPGRAKIYRYKGLAIVNRYLKVPPSEPEKRKQLLNESIEYLLKSLRLGDEQYTTHNLLAALYKETGDKVNSNKHQKKACEYSPDTKDCLLFSARNLAESGNADAARKIFSRLRKANPNDPLVYTEEGVIWQMTGNYSEAKTVYLEALRLDPDSFTLNDNLAYVLFELGEYIEALKYFDKALSSQPDSADALAGKSITLEKMSQRQEALNNYSQAVAKDPNYLDCDYLREKYLWTDRDCDAAAPLIAEIK
jgi:tetratricopeptide (TPR) repeat protein